MRRFLLIAALSMPLPALAGELAIFPVKLLDTSHEAEDQTEDHARRLDLLAETLAEEMPGTVLARADLAAACPRETTDCLMGVLRGTGAERGLFIVVQKTSTLILQMFASVVDTDSTDLIAHKELNFRGDNDEAWRRAARFLARQLRDPG